MRKLARNITLLLIPFIVYLAIIATVDPYSYLGNTNIIDKSIKRSASVKVSPHLYNLLDFRNDPHQNILLGDSRTNNLYRSLDRNRWSNLAFDGGSIKEIVQAFHWAAETTDLDTVVIGFGLNQYNKYNKRFHVENSLGLMNNFFTYAFNLSVIKPTLRIIKSTIGKKEYSKGEPQQTKEEFWNFLLDVFEKRYSERMAYPEEYYAELRQIGEYCRSNGIKLILWIPPTHMDMQNIRVRKELTDKSEVMVRDLQSIADLYNYDYPSVLTADSSKFRDPNHFNMETAYKIRDEMLGGAVYIARKSTYQENASKSVAQP